LLTSILLPLVFVLRELYLPSAL